MTSASPSITTLPATVHTVASVTRRFSGDISVTITLARTVSPGRTGALKRSNVEVHAARALVLETARKRDAGDDVTTDLTPPTGTFDEPACERRAAVAE